MFICVFETCERQWDGDGWWKQACLLEARTRARGGQVFARSEALFVVICLAHIRIESWSDASIWIFVQNQFKDHIIFKHNMG